MKEAAGGDEPRLNKTQTKPTALPPTRGARASLTRPLRPTSCHRMDVWWRVLTAAQADRSIAVSSMHSAFCQDLFPGKLDLVSASAPARLAQSAPFVPSAWPSIQGPLLPLP